MVLEDMYSSSGAAVNDYFKDYDIYIGDNENY